MWGPVGVSSSATRPARTVQALPWGLPRPGRRSKRSRTARAISSRTKSDTVRVPSSDGARGDTTAEEEEAAEVPTTIAVAAAAAAAAAALDDWSWSWLLDPLLLQGAAMTRAGASLAQPAL